eukprot:1160385-Pelagomonas_calceolata.AAC.11
MKPGAGVQASSYSEDWQAPPGQSSWRSGTSQPFRATHSILASEVGVPTCKRAQSFLGSKVRVSTHKHDHRALTRELGPPACDV